jgi:predicted ABC-type ATPase
MILTQYQNTLFVVGGPNGSGKTTLARELFESQDATYISADDIAYELNPQNPYLARIQSGKEFF